MENEGSYPVTGTRVQSKKAVRESMHPHQTNVVWPAMRNGEEGIQTRVNPLRMAGSKVATKTGKVGTTGKATVKAANPGTLRTSVVKIVTPMTSMKSKRNFTRSVFGRGGRHLLHTKTTNTTKTTKTTRKTNTRKHRLRMNSSN
jgi:hypothetical protein